MPRTSNKNGENDNKRKTSTTRKTSRTSTRKSKARTTKKEEQVENPKKEPAKTTRKTTARRTSTRRTTAAKRKAPVKAKAREIRLKKLKDGETISSLAQKIIAKRHAKKAEEKPKRATRTKETTKTTPSRTSRSTSSKTSTARSKTKSTDYQSTKEVATNKSSTSSKSTSSPTSATSTPKVEPPTTFSVRVHQSCAILIDGNNIEMSIHSMMHSKSAMLDFDKMIPKVLEDRGLNRLIYFREGLNISEKLAERLHKNYHGSVVPCHKSADIPLTITATQIAEKVDTIIIMSGDSDYVELVRHLKSRGVRVEIASVKATTAQILTDEADYSYEITKEDCFVFK